MCSFNPRVRAGRDCRSPMTARRPACFNPRVRAGRDVLRPSVLLLLAVSIHASARDATLSAGVFTQRAWFQSTRPRGTRRIKRLQPRSLTMFQSTRPRGTRLDVIEFSNVCNSFNPRVRAGRDRIKRLHPLSLTVSIHASARDATLTATPTS